MLGRAKSGAPPPPPPQEPAPQAGEEDEEDDEFFAGLLDDDVSVKCQHRNEAARHFMVAERRAATERVAEAHAATRAIAHRRNIEVAGAAMAAAEQCLNEENRRGRWRADLHRLP
jgi:hypothetical protein